MRYYKLINGQLIIGIGTTGSLRKLQVSRFVQIISCTEDEAQCIELVRDGTAVFYHASWMKAVPDIIPSTNCEVIQISKEEYDLLKQIEDDEGSIPIDPDVEPDPIPEPDPEDADATVAYAKALKISEMSKTSHNVIIAGIDVELSDGKSHHFSLTSYDQTNLSDLKDEVAAGSNTIPYHEDDGPCIFYSNADMLKIIQTARQHVFYHNTYFNSLKMYIKSLKSLNTVAQVTYGMDIPERYQSDVWKAIINGQYPV